MKMVIKKVALIVLIPGLCAAETITVEPGHWQMSMTMEMSMMPQPQVRTFEECIEEGEMKPEDFSISGDDSDCTFSEPEFDDNTASWTIACPGAGGTMEGQWSITSHGDRIEGEGSMSTEVQGQKIDFNMHWQGHRTGECE